MYFWLYGTYHKKRRSIPLLLLLYVWLAWCEEFRAIRELELPRYRPDEPCCEESLANSHCLSSGGCMAVLPDQPGDQAAALKSVRVGSEVVTIGFEWQATSWFNNSLPETS